jgi:TRAP-type C4-dicarboxylate transport system substrate-binding protein
MLIQRGVLIGASVVLVGALLLFWSSSSAQNGLEQPEQVEVRWLLSHQPTDVFTRSAQVFADELAKESDGTMVLRVLLPEDVGAGPGDVPYAEVLEQFASGSAELASAYTIALGHEQPAFWALNLPFLFSSYEETGPVLDGPAGKEILGTLTGSVRALAFTMSGGFRIIASKNTAVKTLKDLEGKRIATSGGPVAEATLRALGAIPVPLAMETGKTLDGASLDGAETTYARLSSVVGSNTEYLKYINETNHSLFLTAIVVRSDFYDSLSSAQQQALQHAAQKAAEVERADSITLNEETKRQLAESGSVVTELPSSVRDAFREETDVVYADLASVLGKELVDALRGVRNK